MRDAMRRAGVPETKVDDVVQAEEEVEYGIGYVWDVWTTAPQTKLKVDSFGVHLVYPNFQVSEPTLRPVAANQQMWMALSAHELC
jgi:hypothetical protein